MNFAVLMTCFNRKDKTIACLEKFYEAVKNLEHNFSVYLVDDGSTDGTYEEVRKKFSCVSIIKGDGNLYWNGGMYVAFQKALSGNYDYYVWLNDDTMLYSDAVSRALFWALDTYKMRNPGIYIGSTCSSNGVLSYGGSVSLGKYKKFKYKKVHSHKEIIECEVMNGNFVIINSNIVKSIGIIDKNYEHALGDIDYSLRARACGFSNYVMPGFYGECDGNPVANSFLDKKAKFSVRWKSIKSRKGLPFKSWLHFTKKHGGVAWFLYFTWPYIRVIIGR
jgi:GT2 family glycosyltransferase